jgi:hypothetical protein
MTESSTCDSRQYRFGYWLQASSDAPGDFFLSPPKGRWLSAIFLPGDAEALWRTAEYPPRIYVLTRDTLMVYSHLSAQETPFVVPLRELIEIDIERALLHGVVQFYASGSSWRAFRYNACHNIS